MQFISSQFTFTTALLIIFGIFVIFSRIRGWLDSNVPIVFYVILVIYVNTLEGAIPAWLAYLSFALGLILRFEFMGKGFANFIKVLEIGLLSYILYRCFLIVAS